MILPRKCPNPSRDVIEGNRISILVLDTRVGLEIAYSQVEEQLGHRLCSSGLIGGDHTNYKIVSRFIQSHFNS